MKINEVVIDNKKGLGSVPYNQDVNYFGLRVKMKPSMFLNLASHLSREDAKSADKIKELIQSGEGIGAPYLRIDIPETWEDGDYSQTANVDDHEGRNRMMAVKELEGDHPIEVHLFFSHGIKRRNIQPEWIDQLNKALISQDKVRVYGPIFELSE